MNHDAHILVSCMPDLDTSLSLHPITNHPGRVAVLIGDLTVHVGAEIADRIAAVFTEAAAMARGEEAEVPSDADGPSEPLTDEACAAARQHHYGEGLSYRELKGR